MGRGGVERCLALLSAAGGDYSVNKTEGINSMVTAAAGEAGLECFRGSLVGGGAAPPRGSP